MADLFYILVEVQQLWLALVGDIRQFVWNRHSHLWGSRGVCLWRKTTGALENMSVGVPNGSGRHHAVYCLRETTAMVGVLRSRRVSCPVKRMGAMIGIILGRGCF